MPGDAFEFNPMSNSILKQRFDSPIAVDFAATPVPDPERFTAWVTDAIFIWMIDAPGQDLFEYMAGLPDAQKRIGISEYYNYDAYGVEAIMLAPDDTVTIGNNTIGGGGRVNAGQRVILGPRVTDAGLGAWAGSAKPRAAGQYRGTQDKTYTFTAKRYTYAFTREQCNLTTKTWMFTV